MSEKQFRLSSETVLQYQIMDNDTDLNESEVVDLLNELEAKCHKLEKDNEQLKSLINACEYGQKSLMEEMKHNDEALDKIWEIMKELYGVVDDE